MSVAPPEFIPLPLLGQYAKTPHNKRPSLSSEGGEEQRLALPKAYPQGHDMKQQAVNTKRRSYSYTTQI